MSSADHGIYLVGLRGTGKSSLGRALAERMGLPFVDSDQRLAEAHELPEVGVLLERLGEAGFREAEGRIFLSIAPELQREPHVLALGGGALEAPAVPQLLQRLREAYSYRGVWVEAAPSILAERMEQEEAGRSASEDLRPRLIGRSAEEEARVLIGRRARLYREHSELRFRSSEGNPADLAAELELLLR